MPCSLPMPFVAQKTETTSTGLDCKDFREDYFECLHHRKEYERIDTIKEQAKLNEIKAAGGGGGGDEH